MKKHNFFFTLLAGLLFVSACEQVDELPPASMEPEKPYQLSAETKRKVDESVQTIRNYMQLVRQKKQAEKTGEITEPVLDLSTYLQQALKAEGNVTQTPNMENVSSIPLLPPTARSGRTQSSFLDEVTEEGYNIYAGPEQMSMEAQWILNDYHNDIADILYRHYSYRDNQDPRSVMSLAMAKADDAAYWAAINSSITEHEKEQLMASFYGAKELMWDAYDWVYYNYPYSWEYGTEAADPNLTGVDGVNAVNGTLATASFFGQKSPRFWRAVFRVVVAIAVTAVIVAVPIVAIAAVSAIATSSPLAVGSLMAGLLLKGATVGSFTVYGALGTGFAAGIKNAEKNWDKPWQGVSEFTFGMKLKPIYY